MTSNKYKDLLLDLLAVIHGDEGLFTQQAGVERSVEEAKILFQDLLVIAQQEELLSAPVSNWKGKKE